MGAIGVVLGVKVLRNLIVHYKNLVSIVMVICMLWYSLMVLLLGLLKLAQHPKNLGSYMLFNKLSWYGSIVIMGCDYLVATLYFKNAIALYIDKISSSRIRKICLFTWLILFIALILTMISDLIITG